MPERVKGFPIARDSTVPGSDAPESGFLSDVKNPAADATIETLLAATTAEDFTAAVRAFDRILMSGDYVVPLFFLPKVWVAHWSHLRYPAAQPLGGYDLDTWWSDGTK